MNPELIEKITRLVVEKLQPTLFVGGEENTQETEVKLWNRSTQSNNDCKTSVFLDSSLRQDVNQQCKEFFSYNSINTEKRNVENERIEEKKWPLIGINNPVDQEELELLISKTPARIGVGRAGVRPKTETWLKFRFDHAAAVDAVYGEVNQQLLDKLGLFKVTTKVPDKEVYVRRPDFGRKLSDEAKQLIMQKCKKSPSVQIIVSDGLSSKAVDENVEDVYLSLFQSIQNLGLDVGTPFFIEKGRVAAMDDVGELLNPDVIVLLIGERPGLVSAESLSAYLCYKPRVGTIEADRMVVSNIHRGGIPPVEAGAYLGTVIQKILKYQASGVTLVQKEK
ncbi:MAG TPA: ethanolamine ammonia-lyase subunit EutC [Bacillales bacterium]|nr:ethanolamine ammonia-lyase subunit EutC [Bacillales bacterium]